MPGGIKGVQAWYIVMAWNPCIFHFFIPEDCEYNDLSHTGSYGRSPDFEDADGLTKTFPDIHPVAGCCIRHCTLNPLLENLSSYSTWGCPGFSPGSLLSPMGHLILPITVSYKTDTVLQIFTVSCSILSNYYRTLEASHRSHYFRQVLVYLLHKHLSGFLR